MIILKTFLGLYLFWFFFLAVMSLYRAHLNKTISKLALVLGYPILIVGASLDCLMNLTIFSLVFLEFPHEWLVTKRMQRHIKDGEGWRFKLSTFICQSLLNAFDAEGKHC